MAISNTPENPQEAWNNPSKYQTNLVTFYLIKSSSEKWIAVGTYGDYEYNISADTYENLILIIDNLKGNKS